MSGKRQLFFYGKYAHPDAAFFFGCRIAPQNVGGLRKVHFFRDGLHFVIAQTSAIWKHRQWIALEGARGEDIKLREGKPSHRTHEHWTERPSFLSQNFVCLPPDVCKSVFDREFPAAYAICMRINPASACICCGIRPPGCV